MKHLFLILFLVMMGSPAFSQFKELPEAQYHKNGLAYTVYGDYSTQQLAAQVAHTNYCIYRFYKLRRAARIVGFTSFSFMVLGISLNNDGSYPLYGAGCAFGVVSWALSLSAEKWMKRASIKPTQNGATFIYEF